MIYKTKNFQSNYILIKFLNFLNKNLTIEDIIENESKQNRIKKCKCFALLFLLSFFKSGKFFGSEPKPDVLN